MPDCSRSRPRTADGVVMGVRHRELRGRGCAVPPGEHPHRLRPRPAAQLPRAQPARSSLTSCVARRLTAGWSVRSAALSAAPSSWWWSSSCSWSWWSRRPRLTDDDHDRPCPCRPTDRSECSARARCRRASRPAAARGSVTSMPKPAVVEQVAGLTLGEPDQRRHALLAGTGADDQRDRAAAVDERVGRRVGADHDAGRDHRVDLLLDLDLEPVLGRLEQAAGDVDRVVDHGRRDRHLVRATRHERR